MYFIRTALFATLVSALAGCGGGDDHDGSLRTGQAAATNDQASAAAADTLYERGIRDQTCELLTPHAVARVAEVDASMLEQRQMGSMCLYSWEGGQAQLGLLHVEPTIEAARARFESSYRSMSGEDVNQAMQEINAGVERKVDEGDLDVDPEKARQVTGAMGSAFAGGLQFEDVPGVGDLARFETTKTETRLGNTTIVSYANSLNVLTGNLKFTVSFSRDGEPAMYPDESAALARAVIGELSD